LPPLLKGSLLPLHGISSETAVFRFPVFPELSELPEVLAILGTSIE
jgi:hypothetical protein